MIDYMIVRQQKACQKADVDRLPPIHPSPATHVSIPPRVHDTCTHLPPFTPHPITRTPAKNPPLRPPSPSPHQNSRSNSSSDVQIALDHLGRHLQFAKNDLADFGGHFKARDWLPRLPQRRISMGDSSSFAAHCYPRAAPVFQSWGAMFSCVFVCCDERRQVVGRRRINGMCSTCAGAVSNVRVQNVFRCCFVPVCWMQRSRIVCSRCGHHYKTRCSSKP